ncbi:efflux RND transporter periplasmic adaptor subunit [Sulfurimonas sp.]
MTKKKIITVIFLVLAVGLLMSGKALLQKRKASIAAERTPNQHIINVSLVEAKAGSLQEKVSFLATVLSLRSITLSTKLVGYIDNIKVHEAQSVKKGEILLTIDSFELQSSIKALEATLLAQKEDVLLAKNSYARNKKLYAVGGVSREQLQASGVALKLKQAAYDNTKQKIAQLKHQRSYLQIKAPFDGVIDTIVLHEGDLAAVGKPIIKMSQKSKKLLFSYAPHKYHQIQQGQKVFFNNILVGFIKTIYSVADNALTTAEIQLIKKLDMPIGSAISIELLTQEKAGWIVPNTTILHKKDGSYVMVYKEKKFHLHKVTILLENKNQVLLAESPNAPIADASEVKLAQLSSYGDVLIVGAE